jgi:hypothetical protein
VSFPTTYMASSIYPGLSHRDAVTACHRGVKEAYGKLDPGRIQLCPQHQNILDETVIDDLIISFPATRFRLHANVRTGIRHHRYNASHRDDSALAYFKHLASLSRYMQAEAYTLHAGDRAICDLEGLRDNVRRIQDIFDCPVGIEGLYPVRDNRQLVSDWSEYEWLLNSDLYYALDLSHLNIVAYRSRETRKDLVAELLASDRVLEVHLSDNDGRSDSHFPVHHNDTWWLPLVETHLSSTAVVFSEGNQRRNTRPGPAFAGSRMYRKLVCKPQEVNIP